MKTLIFATAAALMFSAPLALAASNGKSAAEIAGSQRPIAAQTMAQRCTALEAQFDKAEAAHRNAPNSKEAVALEREGKSLCTAHKEAAGVKYVQSALKMIAAEPASKS